MGCWLDGGCGLHGEAKGRGKPTAKGVIRRRRNHIIPNGTLPVLSWNLQEPVSGCLKLLLKIEDFYLGSC